MKRKKAKMSVHSGIREINEIVRHAHDEIRASSDEICDCAADEIKSTHPPSRRISSPPGDFIIEDDFSHPTGVDLVEKKKAKMSVHSGIREINEIVRHAHDEIARCARMKSATAPQMKLNPPTRSRGGFHPRQGISSSKMISPTRQGVDLVEKKKSQNVRTLGNKGD